MYALLRRCMISLIEENTLGYKDDNYKFAKNYTDRVINKYYLKTKNLTLNTDEDINRLLNNNNLLALLINN